MKQYDIYLASPLFCDEDHKVLDKIESTLDKLGITYFSPRHDSKLDMSSAKTKADKDRIAQQIFDLNDQAIKNSKMVLANTIGVRYNNALYCFTGDQSVKLSDGTSISFNDMVEDKIYEIVSTNFNTGNPIINKAKLINTGFSSDLVKVHFDDGSIITCTSDHNFLMKDLSYKPANKLKEGDSVQINTFDKNGNLWMDQYSEFLPPNFYPKLDGRSIILSDLESHDEFLDITGPLVYRISNLVNGKSYIGTTKVGIRFRFLEGIPSNKFLAYLPTIKKYMNSSKPSKSHLINSVIKYGLDNFELEILESNLSVEEMEYKESLYIDIYDSFNNGYNPNKSGKFTIYSNTNDRLPYLCEMKHPDEKTFIKVTRECDRLYYESLGYVKGNYSSESLKSWNTDRWDESIVGEEVVDYYKRISSNNGKKRCKLMNNSPEYRFLQTRGKKLKISKSKNHMLYKDDHATKENTYLDLKNMFDSYEEFSNKYDKLSLDNGEYYLTITKGLKTRKHTKWSDKQRYIVERKRSVHRFNKMKNSTMTESFFNSWKSNKWFKNFEDFKQFHSMYNHKVVKIELLDITEKVYCMSIQDSNFTNFTLSNGVVVKNCDAGTMIEIGMSIAKNIPIVSYTFYGYGLNIMMSQKVVSHIDNISHEDTDEVLVNKLKFLKTILTNIDNGMNVESLRDQYFIKLDELV